MEEAAPTATDEEKAAIASYTYLQPFRGGDVPAAEAFLRYVVEKAIEGWKSA